MISRRSLGYLALLVSIVGSSTDVLGASSGFVLSAVRYTATGIGSLDQFDVAGDVLREIPISGFPSNVTMDRFGNSYVIVAKSSTTGPTWQVDKYGPDGQSLGTIIPPSSNPDGPSLLGLGIDHSDRLYVGYSGTFDTIHRFQLDGTPFGLFATISTPAPGAPFALKFDSLGRLYVPDNFDVERFDLNGQSIGIFASVPDNGSQSFIIDLAFDSRQSLYAQTSDGKTYVVDQSRNRTNVLNLPIRDAFDIDSDDSMYAGALFGAGISKYRTDGTPLGVFASFRPGEYVDFAIFEPIPEPMSIFLIAAGLVVLRPGRWRS
jgi:sugar lactone lactonase YvrE